MRFSRRESDLHMGTGRGVEEIPGTPDAGHGTTLSSGRWSVILVGVDNAPAFVVVVGIG